MDFGTLSIVLDAILIAAAIWMVVVARGVGGVVGRTLNIITIGAVITGFAHLLATMSGRLDVYASLGITAAGFGPFFHRLVVLIGFVVLVIGFQQLRAIKR